VGLQFVRTAGADGILSELLKYVAGPISVGLHTVFVNVWESGHMPAEWRDGNIVPLYKGKGSRSEFSSYRSISVLLVPEHVLLARVHAASPSKNTSTSAVWVHSR